MENISIGAGIFYGLLTLSFVILIVKTKDQWKWGRIFAGIIGLPILAIGVIMGFEYYKHMPKPTLKVAGVTLIQPEPTMKFAGLTLNMPVHEVTFLRGEPQEIIETAPPFDRLLVYPFNDSEETKLVLASNNSIISDIAVFGKSDFSASLHGIYLGSDYQAIIDKLGDSFQMEIHSDVHRSFYFQQYNLMIGVKRGKVFHIGLAITPERYGWLGEAITQ
jgi:hypothetical protein